MAEKTHVTLTNGETVVLWEEPLYPYTFVRLNDDLIVGVVTGEHPAIHVWRQVEGVYLYLGDIHFRDQHNGWVLWEVVTSVPDRFQLQARQHLIDQIPALEVRSNTGNHVSILSMLSDW